MRYILDTNIILIYLRDKNTKKLIQENYSPFSETNIPIVSVVSIGEIESIALRNHWGKTKLLNIDKFFNKCVIADINSKDVIKMYGLIDAYSQGKLKNKPLNNSSRNMGKNDIWIAATAAVTNSTLITTDQDFSHLDNSFLNLELIKLVK